MMKVKCLIVLFLFLVLQDGCIVCPATDSTFDLWTRVIKEWYPKNSVLRALTPTLKALYWIWLVLVQSLCCSNVLAIALGNTVYLWDASNSSTSELVTIDDDNGPVTSVSWALDGWHIAISLNNSEVRLWDSVSIRQLHTLRGCHRSRVGSMAWNSHILTTGGIDGMIVNNDVRIRSHVVKTYRGHRQEVCRLKWSASGQQLASGGHDNLVHIWDMSKASSNSPTQ
ncbi:hypothetical protein J1N35_004387 [Gossypium stocksii]|uniref:Anaphase-promoting complex subunit 4-like WD40 domain-containing protein n=1 Tax=Gossypium stocksii TaxID=47602 RepID=A0A9D3WBV5_9ROSI|nr:hypothetical protein J1N35_004387 [Gossypium stocksii]